MKNEKMLERCLELARWLSEEDAATYKFFLEHKEYDGRGGDLGIGGILAGLVHDLEDDIKAEGAKAAGRSNALSAAKRLLKGAMNHSNRGLHGTWEENGRQCMCDGYRGVRLVNPLPFDPIPENAMPLNLGNIVEGAKSNMGAEIELPTIGALKAHISVEKAKEKAKPETQRNLHPVEWDFGEELMAVNAEFLLDMLELLPGCKAYASAKGTALGPIYFESEAGDGILMPRRRKNRKAA